MGLYLYLPKQLGVLEKRYISSSPEILSRPPIKTEGSKDRARVQGFLGKNIELTQGSLFSTSAVFSGQCEFVNTELRAQDPGIV